VEIEPSPDTSLGPTITPAVRSDPASGPSWVDPNLGSLSGDLAFEARYEARTLLGRGGMGEVRLYRDQRIGRDVALKVVRPADGSASEVQARFVREARVQGQLEHPSIVPVYDLAVGPDGTAYFTMKRVRGATLESIIDGLRRGEAAFSEKFSRRKLLSAITSVGLCLEYAHAHGVIHRDLKPGNIMLGDFGEVYVLDWGVAKLANLAETPAPSESIEIVSDAPEMSPRTAKGAVMGTPGYMPPEQIEGAEVDARADIYSLGAILFEVLTLERLHPKGQLREMLASTLSGPERRAEARVGQRDIPPELEAIWTRATELDARGRFRSMREMVQEIERFLDGDRDVELRRSIAQRHSDQAKALAERALARDAREEERTLARTSAIREVGRALALDPENRGAVGTLGRLLLTPPKRLPDEVAVEIERSTFRTWMIGNRVRTIAYAVWFLLGPVVFWMGIRDWGENLLSLVPITLAFLLSAAALRMKRVSVLNTVLVALLSSFALGGTSRMFGPFVAVPVVAALNTMSFTFKPDRVWRVTTIAIGTLAILVPAALEALGVVSPSYVFQGGTMSIVPHVLNLPQVPTLIILAVSSALSVVVSTFYVGSVRDQLSNTELELQRYIWQIKHLVPEDARLSVPAVPANAECAIEAALLGGSS
jgi:serine/threonine-protein kinase